MDKETRSRIQRATQSARRLLEEEFREQLEGTFDILLDGTVLPAPGVHLSDEERVVREKLVAAVAHKRASGLKPAEAVGAYLREAAFTTLNRFVALKMLEARALIQECVSKGEESAGFKEFTALAPGLVALPDKGYRFYLESLFDEIGLEVRVLFDRRDAASLLWPRRQALQDFFSILNDPVLASVWAEDETIGWVYQYFNGEDERRAMREASQAPRNSRELAVRNQFFTPRYVVQFLTDNTLGRTWIEMMGGRTRLGKLAYFVRPSEGLRRRPKKDPRELRILDPAGGSGHFLLYAFDLLLTIYQEAWLDPELGPPLWKALGLETLIRNEPSDSTEPGDGSPPFDPKSCMLRPDARPQCFACGSTSPVEEARFILADLYGSEPSLAGRPMVYCRACAEEKRDRIALNIPLSELRVEEALRCGWSGHETFSIFLNMAEVFDYRPGGEWVRIAPELRKAAEFLPHLRRALPGWILRYNLHGIDIDPRAAQIAALALWMRAQRAFNDFDVPRSERPTITRTNIVVAEPMPGDATLVEEFAATLRPPVIGELFRRMVAEMRLAGEMGSLLKIEEAISAAVSTARQVWQTQRRELGKGFLPGFAPTRKQTELDLSGIDDATFFDDAEDRIFHALREFAEEASGGAGVRRQLFAGDAAQGVAFIDLLRKPFDVTLMNPPFGAGSLQAKAAFEKSYPRTKNDLYAAFVERGVGLLREGGMLGAITSRTGFFLSSFQKWREEVLLKEAPPTVVADLGYGVLDSAMVEVAAYCLEKA